VPIFCFALPESGTTVRDSCGNIVLFYDKPVDTIDIFIQVSSFKSGDRLHFDIGFLLDYYIR
jgi:hypothetical protein